MNKFTNFFFKTLENFVFVENIKLSKEEALNEIKALFQKHNKGIHFEGAIYEEGHPEANILRIVEASEYEKTDDMYAAIPISVDKEAEAQAYSTFKTFAEANCVEQMEVGESLEHYLDKIKNVDTETYKKAMDLYLEVVLSTFKYSVTEDGQEPSLYFVIKEDNFLNNRILADSFEEAGRKGTEEFQELFNNWFQVFISTINDLVNKNFYVFHIYNNDREFVETTGNNLLEVLFGSINEALFSEQLPDDIEDFEAFIKEYLNK